MGDQPKDQPDMKSWLIKKAKRGMHEDLSVCWNIRFNTSTTLCFYGSKTWTMTKSLKKRIDSCSTKIFDGLECRLEAAKD